MTERSDQPERRRAADPKAAIETLLRRVVKAPNRHHQVKALVALARAARKAGWLIPVFQTLASTQPDGPRLAIELISRVPEPLSADLIKAVLPLLASKKVPTPFRIVVAGQMLSSVPDEPRLVGPIVRALTSGATKARAFERLLHVQSRVEKSEALDAYIAASAPKVRMRCPRCSVRLGYSEFIAHLWHKHRLVYDHGKAREPRGLLEEAINEAAATLSPEAIDRTFLLTEHYYPEVEPRQVLQALAARGAADPAETDILLERAAEEHDGLCPVCLSAVPDAVLPLPRPASLADGRLASDGYAVEVTDSPGGRVVTITTPGAATESSSDARHRWSPRQIGASLALGIGLVAFAVGLLLPPRFLPPFAAAGVLFVAWLVYALVRWRKRPLTDRSDRAVEIAWSAIVPGIGRSPEAIRFLIRLCQTSVGVGTAVDRTTEVYELVEHAAVLAAKGGPYLQLLAVARLLQVHDQSRLGRDRVNTLVGVFEPVFQGELPLPYAEAAAEFVLSSDFVTPGDQRRLGALLVETAFENGLTPTDLVTIGRFCPWLRRLLLDLRPDLLGLLLVVWRGRNNRPWKSVGPATTVFELARDEPAVARRLMTDEPDILLRVELDENTEVTLGGVVVTVRGVSVAGYSTADPTTAVDVAKTPTGDWRLHFGPHTIALDAKVPLKLAGELEGWLKYRAQRLVPEATRQVRRTGTRAVALLVPLAVECPLCQSRSLLRTGRIGTPWQAVAGSATGS